MKISKQLRDKIHQRAISLVQEDYPDRYVGMAAGQRELHGEAWTLEEYICAQLIWNEAVKDWERIISEQLTFAMQGFLKSSIL